MRFEIFGKEYVQRARRERGFNVNPWSTQSRFPARPYYVIYVIPALLADILLLPILGECNRHFASSQKPSSRGTPFDVGFGGGVGYNSTGGYGGGAIELLVSGTLTNNGSVSANGTAGTYCGGGGAGGSLYIGANTLMGTGTFSAAGGAYSSYFSADGGGGGRVAIYAINNSSFNRTTSRSQVAPPAWSPALRVASPTASRYLHPARRKPQFPSTLEEGRDLAWSEVL